MPDKALSNYFYGDEATQFTYFRIPCQLIAHPRFKYLSTDSKLLYGLLLDRMSLSIKNGWYDNTGRVYIYYTVNEICEALTCGRDKAMKLLAELDTGKGVGLIERIRQGQGKPDRIYVLRFATQELPPQPDKELWNLPRHLKRSILTTRRRRIFRPQEVEIFDMQRTRKPTLIRLIRIKLILSSAFFVPSVHPRKCPKPLSLKSARKDPAPLFTTLVG